MKKAFLPYELAVKLKELGFDEPCFGFYDESLYFPNNENQYGTFCNQKLDASSCSAPLYQQAFRWFREKYQLHSTITSISQESWQWHITNPSESLGKMYEEDFYTYEEAELACLEKLIEIAEGNGKEEVL